MNKTQLVDALAARLGDRHTAASAVDGLLETIVDTVRSGESVTLTGFGVFEGRARAARTGRNPRTGEPIEVPATTVPAFRPGAGFRTAVGGGGAPAPRSAPRSSQTRTRMASAPAAGAVVEAPTKVAEKQPKAKSNASFAGRPEKAEKKAGKSKAPKSKSDKPKKSKK